ncbi:MAG: hypothetical protein AAB558_01045 [Patescibacteria group bacterium]
MNQPDAVRLERFWERFNTLLQGLNETELQRLLDGLDLIWASTWNLLDTRLITRSYFPDPPRMPNASPLLVRKAQSKVRDLLRACKNHPFALEALVRNEALLGIMSRHELDVSGLLRRALYDVDLTILPVYGLMQACEFRSVSPDVWGVAHPPVSPDRVGRYTFMLASSAYVHVVETEAQVQDMGGAVATMAQLLHFCRQHRDFGEQALTVLALAARWISPSKGVQVCAAMHYEEDGIRHLTCLPVAGLNCLGSQVRILAWRKPGQ